MVAGWDGLALLDPAPGDYGQEDESIPMKTRVRMIEALKYPGLDLSALYPAPPKPTSTADALPMAPNAEV